MRSKKLKTNSSEEPKNGVNEELALDCNDCDHKKTVSKVKTICANSDINSAKEVTNESTIGLNYVPKLTLRCHCKRNDPFDNSTAIWSAAFQPKTSEGRDENRFVATCGANMVCIIDCQQSVECSDKSVIARYIDKNSDELFSSLAWTLIPVQPSSGDAISILAVGGKSTIVLLSDLNIGYHCFERIDAHLDQINALLFIQNDLLFSASYDKSIKLWKTSLPESRTKTQLIRTIDTKDHLLSLSYSKKYNTLLASGHKGVFLWSNPDSTDNGVLGQMKTKRLVDGLHLIPTDEDVIAVRIHCSKIITIIDLKKAIEETLKSDNTSEIKTILLTKVMKTKLQSFDADCPYVYLSAESNLLASGGPEGQIWLYIIDKFDGRNGHRNSRTVKPDRVLEWPVIENIIKEEKMVVDDKQPVIVNKVAISPDLKYLIACTQINLLCIWHKS